MGAPGIRVSFLAVFFGLSILPLNPQELHHATGIINVEVPVRVFDGNRFVDNLTIKDFEVLEDGRPQRIVSLYLVRKTDVLKKEDVLVPKAVPSPKVGPVPETFRNFVLIIEVHDPMPKLDEALDYFFKEIFRKGDLVTVVSPRRTYRFKQEVFERTRPNEIAHQLKKQLRSDIVLGSMDYKSLIREIKELNASEMDGEVKGRIIEDDMRQLRDRLAVNDEGIRRVAQSLKGQEGRKIIFIFYQKEEIVVPGTKYETSKFNRETWRPVEYDVKEVEKIFADASLTVNFIFLTSSTTNPFDIVDMRDNENLSLVDLSDSFFGAFQKMSLASGGTTVASSNALAAFKKAANASENYYLLYYVPSEYKADGKFKEIKVVVKGARYRVASRSGYVAN